MVRRTARHHNHARRRSSRCSREKSSRSLALCRAVAASWLATLGAAQSGEIEVEIEIQGAGFSRSGGEDSAAAIYSRLLDAVSVNPDSGVASIDSYDTLRGIRGDDVILARAEQFDAGIEMLSDTGIRATALEGFQVTSGDSMEVRVQQGFGMLSGGAMDMRSLGAVAVVSADDAQLSIGGDIGASVGGSTRFSAGDLDVQLEDSASFRAMGPMTLTTGEDVSLAARSLIAEVKQDVSVLGRALRFSGSEELAVVAGDVDVQTPGSVRVAGNGAELELNGMPQVKFVSFKWRSNERFDSFENVLPEAVAGVTQVVVRGGVGSATVRGRPGATAAMYLGEADGSVRTSFAKVWMAAADGSELSLDGLTITLDRQYTVTAIQLIATGGSGDTFQGWGAVEFLLGQHVAAGSMRAASASNMEAMAAGRVLLGANEVHVSSATELALDAARIQVHSSEVDVRLEDNLAARANKMSLTVVDTVDVLAGGTLSASVASIEAEVRGSASIAALGAVDLSGDSASMVLSGFMDVTTDGFHIRTDESSVDARKLDVLASESVSLYTADASMSLSGHLDAYVATGDIMARGDLAVYSDGDLSAVSHDMALMTETAHVRTGGKVEAAVGSLDLNAESVDITSDGAITTAAGGDVSVAVGEALSLGVQGSAELNVESLNVQSLNKVGVVTGDDTELLVHGDLGATASGTVMLDTSTLRAHVSSDTDMVIGKSVSVAAGGDVSLASGGSLDTRLKGDVDILGAAFRLSGAKELEIVASEVDVQTPGDIRLGGQGGTVALADSGIQVASASDIEASATGEIVLGAGGAVQMNAGAELDVAAESTHMSTRELTVHTAQRMTTQAKVLDAQISEDLRVFSGGDASGSFGSIQAESRAGAELAAAGAVDLAAESAAVFVSQNLDASAANTQLYTGTASVSMTDARATVAEMASLIATDASLSLSGQLEGFVGSADVLANGDVAIRSSGNLKAQSHNVQLETVDTTQITSNTMDALVGKMKFRTTDRADASRKVVVPLNCANLPGGSCDEVSDVDMPAMRAELAALLDVDESRLILKVRDGGNAEASGGRRQLEQNLVPDGPVAEWTVEELASYIENELGMKQLATAATSEQVDGAMALEMIRPDWQELGASGLKTSRVISALRRLQRKHESL